MSELKLISPMLDNFVMGDPYSDHNGVRCCPAMEKDSDEKYIVKIISVPATENQLNALLLSGAFQDLESALSYFKELSDGYIAEAKLLSDLSRLEGYVSYENWQLEPMDNGNGYDIYLLSRYHRTLEQYYRRSSMTHLGAINLGLDMCAALAVARRAGYLYVALKPSNIILSGENEYKIADIGFLSLDSLKYSSLPEIYRSQYTAPEINDAFAFLNTTIDVYAAGLILYQAYNDGKLPAMDNLDEIEAFPPPAYADYEMSEIILKACALKPEDRWQDPIEMGQALVAYMQRNGANNTPVVPEASNDESDADSYEPVYADNGDDTDIIKGADISSDLENVNCAETEEIADNSDELTVEQPSIEDTAKEIVETTEEIADSAEETATDEVQEEVVDDSVTETAMEENTEDSESALDAESSTDESEDFENLSFLDDTSDDESSPDYIEEDVSYSDVTNEVSDILEQADELISHPAPDPVIPPEPIEVPIPEPIVLDEENYDEEEIATTDESDAAENADLSATECSEEEPIDDVVIPTKKNKNRWVVGIFAFILTAALLFIGFYYYQNFYLQPVSIVLEGSDNALTVYVDSNIDESKLTVVCLDIYGNQLTAKVENGKAEFINLAANSAYTVKVNIDGFHRLTGNTSSAYTTPVQTNIVQFNALTGTEDGSVILGFTIDGPDSDRWIIRYWAEGEEEKSALFSGHMATINQLTVGKEYNFVLDTEDDIFLCGNSEIKFTATKVIKAENLIITGCADSKLTAIWDAPKDSNISAWSVRCYNENGFDKTISVTDTTVTFEEIDSTSGYVIEVTAVGMSVNERALVTANAITISNITVDFSDSAKIVLKWDSNIPVSDKGWVVLYSIDGSAEQELICKEGNIAAIAPYIPGSTYNVVIKTVDGSDVFGGTYTCNAEMPETFSGYDVTAKDIDFFLCRRPDNKNWDRHDLSGRDYITEFQASEKISFVLKMRKVYDTVGGDINVLYVVKDSNGNLLNASTYATTWTAMWNYYYCYLDLPYTPATPGSYTVTVYFNNLFVKDIDFTIANPA